MSYVSECLSDSPSVLLQLNEVGAATNGQTVEDISGNNLDGELTYTATAGDPAWGHPSAVETQVDARQFEGWTNSSTRTGTSRISVPDDPLLDTPGDSTIEAFIRPLADIPLAGDFGLVQKQGACGIGLTFNAGTRFFAYVIDSAGTLWKAIDSTTVVTSHLGEAYHVTGLRLGNALALLLNGQVVASTTITSSLPTMQTAHPFRVHPDTGFFLSARYEMAALYQAALSQARIAAHYAAAKLRTRLRATITGRATVYLNTSRQTPTNFPFSHNWATPVGGQEAPITELLDYKTNALASQPDYEQRVGASPHSPLRSYEYRVTAHNAYNRNLLHSTLWSPGRQYLTPVWTDWSQLTGSAVGTNIPTSTLYKDYEDGGYCCLFTDPADPDTYEFKRIASVSPTALTLTSAPTGTFTSSHFVAPARRAVLSGSLPVTSHTLERETFGMRFDLLPGEVASNRLTAYTPSETYAGLEVFNLERVKVEWLDEKGYELQRRAASPSTRNGRGYQLALDTGSQRTIPARFLLQGREALSEFYGWLDARQGRTVPLWVDIGEHDFNVHSTPSPTLRVYANGYSRLVGPRYAQAHLRIEKLDGTFVNRRIIDAFVNADPTLEDIVLDGAIPALNTIARVSLLKRCRLNQDGIEIAHHRDGADIISQCSLSFLELLTSLD